MRGRWPFVAEKIATRLDLIAPFVHRKSVALPPFKLLPLPAAIVDAPICADPTHWEEVPPNSYWGHADLNFVMKSSFQVPDGWDADAIALHLPLGVLGDIFNHPEALVHIDRMPVASADRYHHTVALAPELADGASHVLSLHGWTGLAGWPPDPECRAKLFMGAPTLVERDQTLQTFHRLATSVLETVRVLDATSSEARVMLQALDAALIKLDTRDPIGAQLYATAPDALAYLRESIARAGVPLDVTLHGIGHAHMDIAYLWPISQIRLKNARTYSNVLRQMEKNPEFRFSHSQPQLYAMTAQDYPDIFAQIKQRVAEGRWEVIGGMWVEPDLNIPGAEALVRQLTLGRRYCKETFDGADTPVLWLPDTFGFPAQIPQMARLAGLKWFATNKLNWNQLNAVPSTTHQWEGIDGSRLLSQVLTTPRDVQYLPFPTNYKSDLSAAEVLGTWTRSTAPDTIRDLPICYGYGDGGGGPTEALLDKARFYADMPGMPQFKFSTVRDIFEKLERDAADVPVWRGEHYMEGHRGVYTSQAWIKRANRKAEWALHEAEALAVMAGHAPDLRATWELLCLNQFHDILTGTSVTQVFVDAREDYARIAKDTEAVAEAAADALALAEPCVLNTAPVKTSRLALVDGAAAGVGQAVEGGALVLLADLPAYSVVPLNAAIAPKNMVRARDDGDSYSLENDMVRVVLTPQGQMLSLYDKVANREVLKPGERGNRLIAFEDRPICWDAWDIDPSYEDRPEDVTGPTEVQIIEDGPLRAAIRFSFPWRSSIFQQVIRLCAHSARIDFVTEVDWHETHTLLKASFPTCVSTPEAFFDIQWGQIVRSTSRESDFDAARFEVPAQKWAQLRDGGYSFAVLNDCKYGYDATHDTLRITLIKCATSPDPVADQGHHVFTYSLLAGTEHDAVVPESYDLNAPLRVMPGHAGRPLKSLELIASDAPNVIVETVKPADDGAGYVLRVFENEGRATQATLTFGAAPSRIEVVDFLEDVLAALPVKGNALMIQLRPFQILSLRMIP